VDPIANLGEGIRRSFLQKKIISEFGYFAALKSCCIEHAGGSNLSDVENNVKFRTF